RAQGHRGAGRRELRVAARPHRGGGDLIVMGAKDRTEAVYVISVAAEPAGVHPQTLRIYERKGLVDPARTVGGSRRYSDADISLLKRIQDLTNAGLNLAGVERVLLLEEENRRLRAELERTREAAHDAVAEV